MKDTYNDDDYSINTKNKEEVEEEKEDDRKIKSKQELCQIKN